MPRRLAPRAPDGQLTSLASLGLRFEPAHSIITNEGAPSLPTGAAAARGGRARVVRPRASPALEPSRSRYARSPSMRLPVPRPLARTRRRRRRCRRNTGSVSRGKVADRSASAFSAPTGRRPRTRRCLAAEARTESRREDPPSAGRGSAQPLQPGRPCGFTLLRVRAVVRVVPAPSSMIPRARSSSGRLSGSRCRNREIRECSLSPTRDGRFALRRFALPTF